MLADLRAAATGRNKKAMRKLVGAYEAAWARLQHEHPGTPRTAEDQKFEDALIDWLKFHRAMLIGELVPFAYKYLRDKGQCAGHGADGRPSFRRGGGKKSMVKASWLAYFPTFFHFQLCSKRY